MRENSNALYVSWNKNCPLWVQQSRTCQPAFYWDIIMQVYSMALIVHKGVYQVEVYYLNNHMSEQRSIIISSKSFIIMFCLKLDYAGLFIINGKVIKAMCHANQCWFIMHMNTYSSKVIPLLMQWRYHSITLSHPYIITQSLYNIVIVQYSRLYFLSYNYPCHIHNGMIY